MSAASERRSETTHPAAPFVRTLFLFFLTLTLRAVAPEGFAVIPAGEFRPYLHGRDDPASVRVPAFLLAVAPVTNAGFAGFVRANPRWRRSRVSPLFADATYLSHWKDDLEPGPSAPPDSPVVKVSWFAASAFATWRGARLPSTAEWERAASAGYAAENGKNDPEQRRDLYAWLARPQPDLLPPAADFRPNYFGIKAMHGLVWEWVGDFDTAMVTGESRGDSGLDRGLFCGGGAAGARDTEDYAAYMRIALRSSLQASHATSGLGFRLARDLSPPPSPSP